MFRKKKEPEIDYEQLWHDSQQKLSQYIEALETKQIQCDTIEAVAENLKVENQALKEHIRIMEKRLLDLPKMLGKTLGNNQTRKGI